MQSDLTLAKLSLVESADYIVRQAGFFANLDSSWLKVAPHAVRGRFRKHISVPSGRLILSFHRVSQNSSSFLQPRVQEESSKVIALDCFDGNREQHRGGDSESGSMQKWGLSHQ
jgi:hypothetical protein